MKKSDKSFILKNGNFFERSHYERINKENNDDFSIVLDNVNSTLKKILFGQKTTSDGLCQQV